MSEMEYFLETLEDSLESMPVELFDMMANNILVNIFQIAAYVLSSLGLYTMAKRRGLHNAWLSWIPIGNLWILGSLADQYRYVARGENKKKRKTLMKLIVVNFILGILIVGLFIGAMVYGVQAELQGAYADDFMPAVMGMIIGAVLCILISAGVGIAKIIIRFMALCDVYRSANPQHAVLFLVLSIFIRVTEPFFLFFNRNSDAGMSRQSYQPYQAYQQPQGSQNYQTYQAGQNSQTYQGYQRPQYGQTYQGYQQPQSSQPGSGYQQPQNSQTYQGYQQPQAGQPSQGYQQPQSSQTYQGYQQPQNSQTASGYQQPQASQPASGYQQPQASQPSQGYQQPQAGQPSQGYQQPQYGQPSQGYQPSQYGQSYPGYQNPGSRNPGQQGNLNPAREEPWAKN